MPDKYPRSVINVMGPVSTDGDFPVTFADLIAGGFHQVETLDDRNDIPAEDPDDPQRRREGMLVYVKETNRIYQLVGGISNDDWEPLDLSGMASKKDIVFQLGTELVEGVMEHTEMWIPYTGKITKVYCSIGEDSDNDSNLLFTIQRYDDSEGWVGMEDYEVKVDERKKSFDADITLDDDKIRIVLSSGDFENLSNMSVIAQFEETAE